MIKIKRIIFIIYIIIFNNCFSKAQTISIKELIETEASKYINEVCEKSQNMCINRLFVVNITDIDTTNEIINFSIGYILNISEIKATKANGFIYINEFPFLIRSTHDKYLSTFLKNYTKIDDNFLENLCKKLCNDTIMFGGCTYRPLIRIIEYHNGNLKIEDHLDHIIGDKYSIIELEDFDIIINSYQFQEIKRDSFYIRFEDKK